MTTSATESKPLSRAQTVRAAMARALSRWRSPSVAPAPPDEKEMVPIKRRRRSKGDYENKMRKAVETKAEA